MKKCHAWTESDDKLLKKAIEDCEQLFTYYKEQNKSYNDSNVWDAIAGRLLPGICVTGAACRRRWEIINKKEDAWKKASELVDKHERELNETTFDGVSELLGNMDALFERLTQMEIKIDGLKDLWK